MQKTPDNNDTLESKESLDLDDLEFEEIEQEDIPVVPDRDVAQGMIPKEFPHLYSLFNEGNLFRIFERPIQMNQDIAEASSENYSVQICDSIRLDYQPDQTTRYDEDDELLPLLRDIKEETKNATKSHLYIIPIAEQQTDKNAGHTVVLALEYNIEHKVYYARVLDPLSKTTKSFLDVPKMLYYGSFHIKHSADHIIEHHLGEEGMPYQFKRLHYCKEWIYEKNCSAYGFSAIHDLLSQIKNHQGEVPFSITKYNPNPELSIEHTREINTKINP